jgi:hypothetical protein
VYKRDLQWNKAQGDWEQYGVQLPSNLPKGIGSVVVDNFWYMGPSPYLVRHKLYDRWETWPAPKHAQSHYSCLVAWRDRLVLLGGYRSHTLAQSFNTTSKEWIKYPDMPDGR